MALLAIPDAGLQLESSASSSGSLPMQAFGITLNDSVIEDMIRCVQNGQKIELALGKDPTFRFDNQEHRISHTSDAYDYDLYLANNASSSKVQRLPNSAMGIFQQPRNVKKAANASKPANKPTEAKRAKGSKSKQLLPPGVTAMAAALSSTASTTRSLPSSPGLQGGASPSLNPVYSATQQLHEKNKEQRSTLVHELAVRDRSYEYLEGRWPGSKPDLKTALGKVADLVGEKWSIRKVFWKELDVWNYDYDNSEDRQTAIDNAVRQYDKQRLGTTSPEWERLLRKEDRGKGIILSKLQATLAKGNITPLPKPPKADDGSKNDSDESSKGKGGGEIMARSNSQPTSSKPKPKVSERDAQTKRLLSNNPKKPTPAPAPKKAAAKPKAPERTGKKVLSEEFVHDSSSEDETPLANSMPRSKPAERLPEKPVEKPVEKSVEKPVEKPVERTVEKVKIPPAVPLPPKPKPKSVVRAPKAMPPRPAAETTAPSKRSREDEDSSSSSGTPLAKRLKGKDPPSKPMPTSASLKHRPSDASQNSRGTGSSKVSINKSKNTSPAKSSPLASSPPTNASDMDESTQSRHSQPQPQHRLTNGTTNGVGGVKKRRAEDTPAMTKRAKVSETVLLKARKFEQFYKKYEELHYDLSALPNPSPQKLDDLLEMRERLVVLKAEIARDVASAA